jgi:thiol-disulfide isomerase/thioredoxin
MIIVFNLKFYAPWCGYCRKLEPIWEDVAKTLYGSSINVAKVDATIYTSKYFN